MLGYDQRGNLIRDARWEYTWDGNNRLVDLWERPAEANFATPDAAYPLRRIRLAYDHLGRRIAKTVWVKLPGVDEWRLEKDLRYVYDGWQMIAELDHTFAPPTAGWQPTRTWGVFDLYGPEQRQAVQEGFGGFMGISGVAAERSVVRSYLWGQDLSGTMTGAGGVGGLLSVTHQGVTYHTCADANGNITGLLTANGEDAGKLVARFDYDPFGNRITNTGPDVEICPMGFSTKYTDSETGLVDYGLRIYSPTMGRWLSRDPIGERGGINLYGMVGNDPVNYWDYLGLLKVIIEHRRTVYGVFATYGELKVTVDDAEIASCCKLPMSFKALEPPTVIGRPIPSSATGHTKNEDTPAGGAYGRTSPQRFHNENPPAAPPGSNPNDYATGMNMELNIYAGKNVHAGINGNSSDGCIIIGSSFIETTLAGDPTRQPGTVAGQNYSVPGFDYSDSVQRYTSLMESLACVRRNNKGNNLKVQYTRTDSGASRQQFNPTPQRPGAGRHENWNPNTDGVGVPAAIPVNEPRSSGGGFMRRLFNDISQIFRR